jgi:hypothetical protein
MLSSDVQYVTLQKYFPHPSLVIYFFSNPTHKTKTGTSNRWETTSSNPAGPIKLCRQSTASVRLCSDFCQPQHPLHEWSAKNILLNQTGMVSLFFI